jgi:hypothetical protein
MTAPKRSSYNYFETEIGEVLIIKSRRHHSKFQGCLTSNEKVQVFGNDLNDVISQLISLNN